MPTVLIANLDSVKKKNLNQLTELVKRGYRFVILTVDSLGNSREILGDLENVQLYVADRRYVRRSLIAGLIEILRTESIDLAEVYPESYPALVMSIILKLARIPVVLIARGAEYDYVAGRMSFKKKAAFRLTYAIADYVIYKELYMEAMLRRMGKTKFWLLPNAVNVSGSLHTHLAEKCTFLYLNTMKCFRFPEIALQAFLGICAERGLEHESSIRFKLVGFLNDQRYKDVAEKEMALRNMVAGKNVPVDLHPWTNNPESWLDEADVFLLPASVVFLNYSLLEAMARGLPALVQQTEGSDLIVSDGQDGFILPLQVGYWRERMVQLIDDTALRRELGINAHNKVKSVYSLDAYLDRYALIYQSIRSRKKG